MQTVNVRYIVNNLDTAMSFYCQKLGFEVEMNPTSGFALLSKGVLHLILNTVDAGGGGQEMPDGETPKPGGWNRIQLTVDDLGAEVKRLREEGAKFRNNIVEGKGGKQILLEDPSGNFIELFESNR
ncbi:VOC family protein [Candidatus Nitrospira salsa]